MRGCSSIGVPRGQSATSRSATSAIEVRQQGHALAVERRQHQLALLHVRVLVEQEHRVAAHDRLSTRAPSPGMQHVGRRGEDLLHLRPAR